MTRALSLASAVASGTVVVAVAVVALVGLAGWCAQLNGLAIGALLVAPYIPLPMCMSTGAVPQ